MLKIYTNNEYRNELENNQQDCTPAGLFMYR